MEHPGHGPTNGYRSYVSGAYAENLPPWAALVGVELGEANRMAINVETMTLADGAVVTLPGAGVTAIVGANNSGKSTLLRQLNWHLSAPGNFVSEQVHLVTAVHLRREGTGADLLAWMGKHATYRDLPPHQGGGQFSRPGTTGVNPAQAYGWWEHGSQDELQHLGGFLVRYADAMSRLGQVGGTQQRGDVAEPPGHPLHQLQDDVGLRHRLDELSQRVFRQPLTLDDLSGVMRLRIGRPDVTPPGPDESQVLYRAALARLPQLEQQGDGMKSLLGLLIPLVTATYPIIIVDEPEAFLHPPQAHALGVALGELARDSGVQVILATHDRNLLAGLLASEAPLSVVRLTRMGESTSVAQLPAEQLKQLWTDPVLRYSNILEGLFHQLVILGEAERDCRFYTAALDAADKRSPMQVPPTDVLFVPSNGKEGMARLAEALRAVAVPVIASPDLDILDDKTVLARLVTALGHDWGQLQADYDIATHQFRQPRDKTRVRDVRDSMVAVLNAAMADDPEARYGPELRDRALSTMRSSDSPWQALKDYGDRAFKGQAAQVADRLLSTLENLGVVAVRVGELEGFAPTLGIAKGKAWLPAALSAGAHEQTDAQTHVARLVAAAGYD